MCGKLIVTLQGEMERTLKIRKILYWEVKCLYFISFTGESFTDHLIFVSCSPWWPTPGAGLSWDDGTADNSYFHDKGWLIVSGRGWCLYTVQCVEMYWGVQTQAWPQQQAVTIRQMSELPANCVSWQGRQRPSSITMAAVKRPQIGRNETSRFQLIILMK